MKVLIIEDVQYIARQLEKYILQYDDQIEVLGIINSVKAGIEFFENNPQPNLIFSDIELSDGICFDIFSQFSINCPIVFITAYDEYLQKSFEINSLDYLLKPIKKVELHRSIEKYRKVRSYYTNKSLFELMEKLPVTKTYQSRFLFKIGKNYVIVYTKDIQYFYSEDKLTFVFTKEEKRLSCYNSLDEIESQIDPKIFFRANRKYLININSIVKVSQYFNSKLLIDLFSSNNENRSVVISQKKASSFKNWLKS